MTTVETNSAKWQLQFGARPVSDGSTLFRVWAPRAERLAVKLIGDRAQTVAMERCDADIFEIIVPDVGAGADYFYLINDEQERPDPVSRWQPAGVHGPSRVVDPDAFAWTDQSWRGLPLREFLIYELHTGTFTPEGTFGATIPKLEPLQQLGVTAIELMPVAEFPGGRNWGYDGTHPYAPQSTYGGPAGLKRLIDACHAAGLAVVLDVVYNHLGPEGNYLERFGPYLTDRHRTPWGKAVNFDGADSRPVRDFVIENALAWLRDYHLDGLRLDAVHAIVDDSRPHVLEELAARVHELDPPRLVGAEKPAMDPALLAMGVDGQWADDLHHSLHVLLTGEREGYYARYGRVADLAAALLQPDRLGVDAARVVGFAQNHDQV